MAERTLTLTVKDRFMIGELYPERSNLMAQIIAKDISEKVEITQEEGVKIGLVAKDGQIIWDDKKAFTKDVSFSESEISFLKDQIIRKSQEQQVTRDMIDTIKKIQAL